jgi:cysteinyl-tRNA synthetase
VMWEMTKSDLSEAEKWALMKDFDTGLGLGVAVAVRAAAATSATDARIDITKLPENIQALLAERTAARKAKDYAKADDLRFQLSELRYTVVDRGSEQVVYANSK